MKWYFSHIIIFLLFITFLFCEQSKVFVFYENHKNITVFILLILSLLIATILFCTGIVLFYKILKVYKTSSFAIEVQDQLYRYTSSNNRVFTFQLSDFGNKNKYYLKKPLGFPFYCILSKDNFLSSTFKKSFWFENMILFPPRAWILNYDEVSNLLSEEFRPDR